MNQETTETDKERLIRHRAMLEWHAHLKATRRHRHYAKIHNRSVIPITLV